MTMRNSEETNSLKILHIAGWYPSDTNPVAGIFVKEHIKTTALSNDVVVIFCEGVDKSLRQPFAISDRMEDGLRTLRIRFRKPIIPKTYYLLFIKYIFLAVKKLLQEGWTPNIIHAHVYCAGVPAVLLGKKYGLPVITTEHFTGFPRNLLSRLERLKAKFAFENSTFVCPVSKHLQNHIERYGIKANFEVIPNTVDTTLFHRAKPSVAKGRKKRLLTVALLDPKKGIPYLIEALALLRKKRDDFTLDIIGDGPNRKEYEQISKRRYLENIITFHGLKTKSEVAQFMRQSDIFVLPSLFETFGVVLIEAMASGLPLIVTDIGGPREIVTNDIGIIVPPENPQALSEAIDHMLDHYSKYSPEKIIQHVKKHYSYEAVGNAFNQVYHKALTIFHKNKRKWR